MIIASKQLTGIVCDCDGDDWNVEDHRIEKYEEHRVEGIPLSLSIDCPPQSELLSIELDSTQLAVASPRIRLSWY